jgi:anthranilate synthase component 1
VVTDGQVVETDDGNPLDFIAAPTSALQGGAAAGAAALLRRAGRLLRLRRGALHRAQAGQDLESGGIDTPDILLLQTEEVAVIDNLSGRLYLIVWADPGQPESYFNAKRRLSELADKLRFYSVTAPPVKRGPSYAVEREFDKADYLAAVA